MSRPEPTHTGGASPDDVVRDSALRVLERHRPHETAVGRPGCGYCAEVWPCPSVFAAHQALALAGHGVPLVPRPRPAHH